MGKQEIRSLALGAVCLLVSSPALPVTSPRNGGALPDAYFQARARDGKAFTVEHGWAQKAARLRAERQAYLAAPGSNPSFAAQTFPVADTLRVPVLPVYFSDQATPPTTSAALQAQFFGANATGSVTDYYHEVSYNQLTVTGTVYPWTHLSNSGTPTGSYYYGSCNGLDYSCARTGELIKEALDAQDAAVDFGQYDNDGPDGIPNSGDDDGVVDGVVFVHSLTGGECGNASFISHTYRYDAWPPSNGSAYTTNDPRTGGGFIQIDEYTIVPAGNCGATAPYSASELIDVGVLCHELGHVMGLPDLYDVNGGGAGIGDWGIMGSGNWNTPEKPAHMDAWCKQELGWLAPTDITWQSTPVTIPDVEDNAVVYRLPFSDERFRRSTTCVLDGSYSMFCGLTAAEASTRHYAASGPGYGSNWYQTIERSFHYSGSGSVTLQYQYRVEAETNYDFARAIIKVGGTESQLAQYTGSSAGSANISLTGYLAPLAGAGGTYTIKFRVISDYSFDDSDGQNATVCGAFSVDDVSVNGGGESYATGFEASADGWHTNPLETVSDEYWLVENRERVGFDANLHGEGLCIWHVDDGVLHAPLLVNRGTNGAVRGLVLEEAEGIFDLNGPGYNNGEPADVFPGTTNNTSFTSVTTPNSNDNLLRPTRIQVTGISAAGASMSATLRAGDPGPLAGSVLPAAIDNDQTATLVTVSGSRLRYGASFHFTLPSGALAATDSKADGTDIVPSALEWVDENTLRGTVNVYLKTAGKWNLVVDNPDGQTVTADSVLTLNLKVATRLVSAHIDVIDAGVRLSYELLAREPGEVIRLYRADGTQTNFTLLDGDLASDGNTFVYVDRGVEPGHSYTYLLESRTVDGDVQELHRGTAVVPSRDLVLEQNVPNPFNPRTSIRFYLPARTTVRLDIYDVRGALVRHLAGGVFDSGSHVVEWDGTDAAGNTAASGFYAYRLVTDGHRALTRKMMLLK
ncbi:MAG TPA: M6 family metalloprotease domain-containing protein [Candidatus Krumholzibacteria bacterium]|nr:M6 family metalloprotease domain-containing protein [Candidatus Krumholzibacteria bacterium]